MISFNLRLAVRPGHDGDGAPAQDPAEARVIVRPRQEDVVEAEGVAPAQAREVDLRARARAGGGARGGTDAGAVRPAPPRR